MSGPSVEQVSTLSPQAQGLLGGLFGPGGGGQQALLQQLQPGGAAGTQQQLGDIGNIFANLLAQPSAQQRTLQQLTPTLQGLAQGTSPQDLARTTGAFFQQQLSDQLAAQREAGPRFAAQAQQTAANLRQRATTESGAFFAGLQQQNIQNQLRAALAQQTLAQGADISQLGRLQAAGQFGLGRAGQQIGQQQAALQGLLGGLFQPQQLVQQPGTFGQIAGGLGAIGGFALGGPFGAAIGGQFGSQFAAPGKIAGAPRGRKVGR